MDRSQLVTGGLLLVAIVLIPGIAKYALTQVGYATVGTAIWYGGYGMGVLLVWGLWLRPLDITGPNDSGRPRE